MWYISPSLCNCEMTGESVMEEGSTNIIISWEIKYLLEAYNINGNNSSKFLINVSYSHILCIIYKCINFLNTLKRREQSRLFKFVCKAKIKYLTYLFFKISVCYCIFLNFMLVSTFPVYYVGKKLDICHIRLFHKPYWGTSHIWI